MKDTKETSHSTITYEEIADTFTRNANSLLSEKTIQQTLNKEKKRFENASALQISPIKFVGGNTDRHCKDLLRKNQPFSPLYLLLNFLTETSLALLIFGLMIAAYQHVVIPGKSFDQPFPALYAVIVAATIVLSKYLSHTIWLKCLTQDTDNPQQLLGNIRKKTYLANILLLLLCITTLTGISITGWYTALQMTILDSLVLYAACALLAGIHNVVYDSHIISFLSVGIDLLNPRRKFQTAQDVTYYLSSSLTQILGQKLPEKPSNPENNTEPKTKENSSKSESRKLWEAKEILRSRLLSFRTYDTLAFFILLILDILCLYQLLHSLTLPLLGFFLLTLLGTMLCVVVFLSAQTILKQLQKEK